MSWEIRQGDVLDRLREMPDESVQCCVTSPPYWGLRDYGVDGQLGLEETPEQFVAKMVEVFREVRRVLRGDGTCWMNIGDSYAGSWGAQSREHAGKHAPNISAISANQVKAAARRQSRTGAIPPGTDLKPKDLVGIPWMLAFALRADGWYLRRDIIWSKPNPMPESVTDRPTSAHEYVFLLTKAPRYYYDAEAIREAATWPGQNRTDRGPRESAMPSAPPHRGLRNDKQRGHGRRHDGFNDRWDAMSKDEQQALGRNKRSVWTIATRPYPEAHFATFPPDLVEPCILAGTSPKVCGECGAPWRRGNGPRRLDESRPQARRALALAAEHGLTEAHIEAIRSCGVTDAGKAQHTQSGFGNNDEGVQALADEAKAALGGYYREFLLARPSGGSWEPICFCHRAKCIACEGACDCTGAEPIYETHHPTKPAVVLDPFSGAATTGLVATQLGRDFIGIELNPEYVALGEDRIRRWEANPAGHLKRGASPPLEGQVSIDDLISPPSEERAA